MGIGTKSGIMALAGAGSTFTNVYSVQFDGTDDYIETDATYSELDGLTKASFSIWIKPTSVSSLKLKVTFDIGRGGTGNQTQCRLWVFEDNRIEFSIFSSGAYVRGDISSITYGSWNHIAVAIDLTQSGTDRGRIYVNGVDETTSVVLSAVSSFPTATDELYIGEAKNGQYNPFLGKIDEFAIWAGTTLTSGNASTLYNSGVPTDLSQFSTPPTTWYRFEEGSGTTISDSIGSADASIVNQTSFVEDVPS